MNYEIKEIHVVFLAIIFLIIITQYDYYTEGFATEHHRHRRPIDYMKYKYYNWYDWYYWLYYINPWYPPRQVDLPFEGRDGGISWYEPWTGGVYNY